ncbi:MAG: hypothetical protein ACOY71_11515 [Gemmatimonadota bacterium]
MSAAVPYQSENLDLRMVTRGCIQLGLLTAALVAAFGFAMQYLGGMAELIVCGIILVAGAVAVSTLPGLWTRARGIDGIATAAGIGLGAAIVFLIPDVAILRPIGVYTNRWDEIGGFSNWWHHPVWWMLGSFSAWMGAAVLAAQTKRNGAPSVPGFAVQLVVVAAIVMVAAVFLHVPGASWGLGTFGVSLIAALGISGLIATVQLNRG